MGTSNAPDILIIGGGILGCAISWRLAQRGVRVTVLERSIPGAEASSAAAGILAPQAEAEGPGAFLDLCLRSRALYGAFTEELRELTGVDVAYRPCGVLHAAFDELSFHKQEATVAWQKAYGLRAALLTGEEARRLEPALSPQALGAAHFPDDHQVDNQLLVRALSMAAARAGVTFQTGYVRGLKVQQGRVTGVDLDGVVLETNKVIIAAGSWSALVPGLGLAPNIVSPARGQMLQLQTRLPVCRHILFSDKGYVVPRSDGRVIAGSTMEHVGFEKQVTAAGLAKILGMVQELCPDLGAAPVQGFWAGLRPYTPDRLPILGEGPLAGLFLATGHFRNGILLTPLTAKLLTEQVLGERSTVDLSPFRFDRFRTWQSVV